MSSELELWARTVAEYGGRIGSDDKCMVQALQQSNLGSSRTIPTSGLATAFPDSVALAEVKLPSPLLLDATFDLPNVGPSSGVDPGIDIGTAAFRITWGIPGAPQMTVLVDAARGFRRTFMASFLRIEFVPVPTDILAFPAPVTMPGAQARNLEVSAMVGPTQGGADSPLRRTAFMGDLAALGLGGVSVPNFVKDFHFTAEVTGTGDFSYRFVNGFFSQIFQDVTFTPTAANGMDFALTSFKRPVPQRSMFMQVQSNAAGVVIANPQIIYELAL